MIVFSTIKERTYCIWYSVDVIVIASNKVEEINKAKRVISKGI